MAKDRVGERMKGCDTSWPAKFLPEVEAVSLLESVLVRESLGWSVKVP